MSLGINTRITNTREQPSTFNRGKTLYVGGTGDGNYTKIQDAINDSVDGDTVFVYDDLSPYYEYVEIKQKSINLIGEDKNTTIIHGNYGSIVIKIISVDYVNISGLTIGWTDWLDGYGIRILHSNYITINNNIITEHAFGISIGYDYYDGKGIVIFDNHITFNTYSGISYNGYKDCKIFGNNIINNGGGIGLFGLPHANITKNNLSNNRDGDISFFIGCYVTIKDNYIESGIIINDIISSDPDDWSRLLIQNNSARTGPIRFYTNRNNIIIPTNTGQVIMFNCSNCIIQNLNFSNIHKSIILVKSSYNIIRDNIFYWDRWQYARDSIYLLNSNHNIIFNNIFYRQGNCIYLSKYCDVNIIAKNKFYDTSTGIPIYRSCFNNKIVGNNLVDNHRGIFIYDQDESSSENFIYHNNFYNSSENHACNEGANIWDNGYPSGGNYWDDYTGDDTNGDGIGDIPYNISDYHGNINAQDNYPLRDPIIFDNIPPILINLSGPSFGQSRVEYTFQVEIVDVEEDLIFCRWNWGDNTQSGWMGPSSNWNTLIASHTWKDEGCYNLSINLKDSSGAESRGSFPFMVIIENEKPIINIVKPEKAVYYNNYYIMPRLFGLPIIFGDIEIIANTSDHISGIDHVEFYDNGRLIGSDDSELFSVNWSWKMPHLIHLRLIKVIAYDRAGNKAQDQMLVRKFFFNIN